MIDMHCHLDFLPNPAEFAHQAAQEGLAFFSNTVAPEGYQEVRAHLEACPNVRVGVGLHPWWVVDDDRQEERLEQACSLAACSDYVGEVGLDFGKRHQDSMELQLKAFRAIAETCACKGGKLISVHAVKSAEAVLDILETSGCLGSNQVVLHWYSGSDTTLRRAIADGCWFSVGERMLATKRGKQYVRLIPAEKLLLETDLPAEAGEPESVSRWLAVLESALEGIEGIREQDLSEMIVANSLRLLKF